MNNPQRDVATSDFPFRRRSKTGSRLTGLLAFLCVLAFAHGAWADLTLLFDTSKYSGGVWLQVQDPFVGTVNGLQATYSNGQKAITFGTHTQGTATVDNFMSNPVKLSDIGTGGLDIAFSNSCVFYLFYDDPSLGANYLTTAPSVFDTLQRYQQFELTMRGVPGDQGNLTNIDCFTAPLSLSSYQYNPWTTPSQTPLKTTGYGGYTTVQIEKLIIDAGGALSALKEGGKVIRYIGPSKYDPSNSALPANPWNSFINYAQSLSTAGTQTTLQRSNAFGYSAWTSTQTYTFGIDMVATAAADGTITATGKVTASVANPASVTAGNPALPANGAWTDVSITLSPTTGAYLADSYNQIIYGQSANPTIDPTTQKWVINNAAISLGPDWDAFQTFCINTRSDPSQPHDTTTNPSLWDLSAYNTTLNMAIGELTTGLLGGYYGSVVEGTSGGVTEPIGQMTSQDWWNMSPQLGFSQIQTNSNFYNRYANVIWTASNNTVYGVPYSDRFGSGPLVDSVPAQGGTPIGYWVIGVGAPVGMRAPTGPLDLLLLDE